jgi:hypothetical protein
VSRSAQTASAVGAVQVRPQMAAHDLTYRAGHGAKAGSVREKAVLALLSTSSLAAAAAAAGVGERTLRRWLANDSTFRQLYDDARENSFKAGLERVQLLMARAVSTLEELLELSSHPAIRLGAARTVAELAIERHDAETLLRRLEELEAAHQEFAGSQDRL